MKYFAIIIALMLPTLASAQTSRNPCFLNGQQSTNGIPSCESVSTVNPLPVTSTPSGDPQPVTGTVAVTQSGAWSVSESGYSYVNMFSNANIVLKETPGVLKRIVVNTAGVSSTVSIYDNNACMGDTIGTYSTTNQTSLDINASATVALCATTAGDTPADITVLFQ